MNISVKSRKYLAPGLEFDLSNYSGSGKTGISVKKAKEQKLNSWPGPPFIHYSFKSFFANILHNLVFWNISEHAIRLKCQDNVIA